MAEFWQLRIGDWNCVTDDLTLEQEAALLRVLNAIHLYDQPICDNLHVLAGLWRCNNRKAARLRGELLKAGLITVSEGFLTNQRAMEDVSNRRQLRVDRASSGHRGGVERGKALRKSLNSQESGQANASTIEENRREESPQTPIGGKECGPSLQLASPAGLPRGDDAFDRFWSAYPRHEDRKRAQKAFGRILDEGRATAEQLTAGANRYAAQMAEEGRNRTKIKNATTWLDGDCWEDEFSQPAKPTPDHTAGMSPEEKAEFNRRMAERSGPQ